jgi:arylsulfatase A-like enzyme
MRSFARLSIESVTMLLLVAAAAPAARASTPERQTNIVVILADDLGFGEVQSFNPGHGKIPTPHVDRLADQGMMFTDAHSASSVCTPTRYGLLTGRYPWRTRLQRGVIGPGGHKPLIAADRTTLADMLAAEGYHTAMFGKWHLGFEYDKKSKGKGRIGWRVVGGPTTRGFDYFYGFPLSRTMSTVIENDQVVDDFPPRKMLPTLAERAAQYVHRRAASNEGAPFFLYLALNAPHGPIVPSKRFQGKTGLGKFADFVHQTDWAAGQVLKALEETGLAGNTLVIFTSDNGTSAGLAKVRQLQKKGHDANALVRGYKSDIWDGGHRVPFVARWPGVIEPGSQCDELICLNDIMATAADVLDVKLADGEAVDSVSILPLLRGSKQPVRQSVIHHSFTGRFAIRKGDWKLALCAGSGGWTLKDNQARRKGLPQVQLYNMHEEIGEQRNLYDQRPHLVRELVDDLQQDVTAGRTTPGPDQSNAQAVNIWKNAKNAKAKYGEKNE